MTIHRALSLCLDRCEIRDVFTSSFSLRPSDLYIKLCHRQTFYTYINFLGFESQVQVGSMKEKNREV